MYACMRAGADACLGVCMVCMRPVDGCTDGSWIHGPMYVWMDGWPFARTNVMRVRTYACHAMPCVACAHLCMPCAACVRDHSMNVRDGVGWGCARMVGDVSVGRADGCMHAYGGMYAYARMHPWRACMHACTLCVCGSHACMHVRACLLPTPICTYI
jgi:hypothetical protein